MNKEQQELLDKSYENFSNKTKGLNLYLEVNKDIVVVEGPVYNAHPRLLTQEEFINKCKTDTEFSENWGLWIEERELSRDEKEWQLEKTNCINDIENDRIIYGHEWEKYIQEQYEGIESTQGIKIPTRLITITYNDKTIENHE